MARDASALVSDTNAGSAMAPGASAKTLEAGGLLAGHSVKVPSVSMENGNEPWVSFDGNTTSQDLSKDASDAGAQQNGQSVIDSLVILPRKSPMDVLEHNKECLV